MTWIIFSNGLYNFLDTRKIFRNELSMNGIPPEYPLNDPSEMVERKNAIERASIVLEEARKKEFISRDRYFDVSAINCFSGTVVQCYVKPGDFRNTH